MIGRSIHVAVLDDNPSVRAAFGRLLKTAGMAVDTYNTSDQLFESVALKCPDCLLLDFEMPGMNGLGVLKYLNQRHIRIPTIVITGSNVADCFSNCLNAGAIACLNKPPDADQLIQMIEKIFKSTQPDRLASEGEEHAPAAQPSQHSRAA